MSRVDPMPSFPRRRELLGVGLALLATGACGRPVEIRLTPTQSRAFRAWVVKIVATQLRHGPTPRWEQRDCVGLVRFAVAEALRPHDAAWRRANSLADGPVPPEVALDPAQQALRHCWRRADGSVDAYVNAIELVQENTRRVARNCNLAEPGDLLFFDHGDQQHLMLWMGTYVAYHTGSATREDNGLRAYSLAELLRWPDTRWQPDAANPNFAGVYRLAFLSA